VRQAFRPLQDGETPRAIVAARWRPGWDGVPGSTHSVLCELCGRLVLLAPETLALLPAPVWCIDCAIAEVTPST
jgi:hypothetical protein